MARSRLKAANFGAGFGRAALLILALLASGELVFAESAPEMAPQSTVDDHEWTRDYGARLIADFDSGIRLSDVEELWRVLHILWQAKRVPVKEVTPAASDASLCAIVASHLRVPAAACTEQLASDLIAFSAAHGGGDRFAVGVPLRLPLIEVESYTSAKQFDLLDPRQRKAASDLLNDPAHSAVRTREFVIDGKVKDTNVAKKNPVTPEALPRQGIYTVESAGIRWKLPLAGALNTTDLNDYESLVQSASTSTRRVGIERAPQLERVPAAKFTGLNAVVSQCDGKPASEPMAPVAYESLLAPDPLYSSKELAQAQECPENSGPPHVVIVDQLISPHPDIASALGKTPPPKPAGPMCGVTNVSNSDEYHGTYLAGIVAAKGEHQPFRGINPDAKIGFVPSGSRQGTTYINNGPSGLIRRLNSELVEKHRDVQTKIVLYASTFGTQEQSGTLTAAAKSRLFKRHNKIWLDELRDPRTRYDHPPKALDFVDNFRQRALFVVSAGQDESESNEGRPSPLSLREVSNMSPQNLGTNSNVLVVTACVDCKSADNEAAIWDRAYYSAASDQIVQIAAPGGEKLAGLLTESGAGTPKSGGTSAAAAIIAGIASRMLACHPKTYVGRPNLIKERLFVTARRNLRREDAHKARAGIVDPALALFDPHTSWLKPKDGQLQAVKVEGWCGYSMEMFTELDELNIAENPSYHRLRRITQAGSGKDGKPLYAVREMARHSSSMDTPNFRILTDLQPQKWQRSTAIAILSRPGGARCRLLLEDIADFIRTEAPDEKFFGEYKKCLSSSDIPRCF